MVYALTHICNLRIATTGNWGRCVKREEIHPPAGVREERQERHLYWFHDWEDGKHGHCGAMIFLFYSTISH
jgi:hypothetical protein